MAKPVKKNKKTSAVKVKSKTKVKTKIKAKVKAKPKLKIKAKTKVSKMKPKVKAIVKATAKAKTKVVAKTKAKATPKIATKTAKVTAKPVTATKSADYNKVISPLADRLVVRVIEGGKTTKSGLILLTDSSSAQGYMKATVLAAGKGATNKKGFTKKLDVQVGDQVLFSEYAGTKIEFNNEELYIVNETDVLGVTQSK